LEYKVQKTILKQSVNSKKLEKTRNKKYFWQVFEFTKKLKIFSKKHRETTMEGDVMARTKKDAATLRRKANEILKDAERLGLGDNFMFQTTFARYQTQLKILEDLEKAIEEYGATVTKEYVKGRENLVSNPAITEFNRTSTAANGTVATLINILKSAKPAEAEADALAEFKD
jgi:hypothetical protein